MKWKELKECFHLTPEVLSADYPDWQTYPFCVFVENQNKTYGCYVKENKIYLTKPLKEMVVGNKDISYEDMQKIIMEINEDSLEKEIIIVFLHKENPALYAGFSGEFAVLITKC